ncbi:hypothetical protein AK812_SmicGene16201 [Symbiodinium microadriaticum]|uniref:Uncharacterized protein n=1 Tax=Symbiodinium microadriaticum TaxID=2951 RepID=A0A1Q9E0Y2_SYMMI|nr:hypothetical protein AK812_SmicGene16201 [Symbiodinium microadriaticum]
MSVWSPASWVYIVVTYYRDDLLDLGGVPAIVVGRLLEADLSCAFGWDPLPEAGGCADGRNDAGSTRLRCMEEVALVQRSVQDEVVEDKGQRLICSCNCARDHVFYNSSNTRRVGRYQLALTGRVLQHFCISPGHPTMEQNDADRIGDLLWHRGEVGLAGLYWLDGQPGAQQQQPATAAAAAAALGADQVDRLVRQRLDQAFSSVFGRLVESSERAAAAAEKQATVAKSDNLVRNLKCEQWRPQSREEELRTWREWYFGFTNYVAGHDPLYETELREMDVDKEQDHRLMTDEMVARSQRIFSLLCSLLKGRPLLLVRSCEETKAGYEAVRILRNSMEPREKSRSLALMRQLAAWRFDEKGGMHEQLVRYEEALKAYEVSSGQAFPEDLVLATVVGGLKEPLRSQVQLKMTSATKYVDVRSWVLQYESLSTPWGFTAQGK